MPGKSPPGHVRWHDGALATLISPIPIGMHFAITLSIEFDGQRIESVLLLLLSGYFFGFLLSAAIGFPLFLASQAMGITNWDTSVAAGTAVGLLAATVFKYPLSISLREAALYGALGASSGLTFWLAVQFLALRRNRMLRR